MTGRVNKIVLRSRGLVYLVYFITTHDIIFDRPPSDVYSSFGGLVFDEGGYFGGGYEGGSFGNDGAGA